MSCGVVYRTMMVVNVARRLHRPQLPYGWRRWASAALRTTLHKKWYLGHNAFNHSCLAVILGLDFAIGRSSGEDVIDLYRVKAGAHRKCSRGKSRSACAGSRRSAHASSHSRASAPPVPPPLSAPADTDSSRFNDKFLYTYTTTYYLIVIRYSDRFTAIPLSPITKHCWLLEYRSAELRLVQNGPYAIQFCRFARSHKSK